MVLTREYVDIPVDGRAMRTFVAAPRAGGPHPGVVFYTDIFQLTEPSLRWAVRLAGYGYLVAVPEIYHRIEPAGTVLEFDDEGKVRGQGDADATTVADFDADVDAALAWLGERASSIGAAGHCTGGHLAFRAAFRPQVRATACWYATGLHDGKLGKDPDAGSLARAGEIEGELLTVWGTHDPHTPEAGRETIRPGSTRRHAADVARVRGRARLRPRRRRPLRPGGDRRGVRRDDHAVPPRALGRRREQELLGRPVPRGGLRVAELLGGAHEVDRDRAHLADDLRQREAGSRSKRLGGAAGGAERERPQLGRALGPLVLGAQRADGVRRARARRPGSPPARAGACARSAGGAGQHARVADREVDLRRRSPRSGAGSRGAAAAGAARSARSPLASAG